MHTNTLLAIQNLVSRVRPLGERRLDSGVELVGYAPHVGTHAYLHRLFPALGQAEISQLEQEIGRSFPPSLWSFYEHMNGIDLFVSQLAVHGLRRSYVRQGDAAYQPYSLITPNTFERPRRAAEDWVFFSSYRSDGSMGVIRGDSTVFRCPFPKIQVIEEWPDLDTYLIAETSRIAALHDEAGRRIQDR